MASFANHWRGSSESLESWHYRRNTCDIELNDDVLSPGGSVVDAAPVLSLVVGHHRIDLEHRRNDARVEVEPFGQLVGRRVLGLRQRTIAGVHSVDGNRSAVSVPQD